MWSEEWASLLAKYFPVPEPQKMGLLPGESQINRIGTQHNNLLLGIYHRKIEMQEKNICVKCFPSLYYLEKVLKQLKYPTIINGKLNYALST